jgi:uncharacterized protein YjbI with pentapeptide repeats
MNEIYKAKTLPSESKFEDFTFENYDFTRSAFGGLIFKNVVFEGCLFDKTVMTNTRFWCCFFQNCRFSNTNLAVVNLFSWGGAMSGCTLFKCQIHSMISPSYIIDSIFDKCKILRGQWECILVQNVKFIGTLNDFCIFPFKLSNINQYQTPEKAEEVSNKIKKIVGKRFDLVKPLLKNVDFSEAELAFSDFKTCDFEDIIPPNDERNLLINNNLSAITQLVLNDIDKNWGNEATKSWAKYSAERYKDSDNAIISHQTFKYYENDEFADKLMALFKKHAKP